MVQQLQNQTEMTTKAMGRLIAIGDIHGRLSKLEDLIEQIGPNEDDRLVFLGDYIDSGAQSYEVVEHVIRLKKEFPNTVTLRGNHEDFVISLFMGNLNPRDREIWLTMNGGRVTLASYRKKGYHLNVHQEFYMSLEHSFETEEFFFCHAGIRPGVPLNAQRKIDLLEIDEPFLSSGRDFGKIVVHGHTITDGVVIKPNRIGLDTGAAHHGPLSAIELPSLKIWESRGKR